MAKTGRERQAAYRARRYNGGKSGDPEFRINTWISSQTHSALERLAVRYGVTKREMLERLIIAEDERIQSEIEWDSPEWGVYFNKQPVPQ
jgi:hypothetical protein